MAGRPRKEIDWVQFEQLCALQCTQDEIGAVLRVHGETLSNRVKEHYEEDYSTVYKRFQESGKCSLRRNQFVLSKKNASMAIWLGKIWLEQKDPTLNDVKEDIYALLRSAVRDIIAEPRIASIERSPLEDQQPLLDQGRAGQQAEVSTQLGTENTMGTKT